MWIVVASSSDLKVCTYGPFRSERAAERWAKARRPRTYVGEHYDFLACEVFAAHEHPALAKAIAGRMEAAE